MRNILTIGHNELRIFLKNPGSFIWLIAMPLAFVYFMSFAAREQGKPGNYVPPVVIENLDTGFLGAEFIREMSAQGLWRVDTAKGEKAGRGVRIPEDFTRRVLAHEQAKVVFFKVEGSTEEASDFLAQARLVRALVNFNSHLFEAATQGDTPDPLTADALHGVGAKPDLVTLDAKFAGRRPVPTSFNFSLPGNLVMYLGMNLLIFGGVTVATTRASGVPRRIAMQPVRKIELMLGLMYGLMLLGVVQIVGLLVLGKFLFHVNLGANLPGVLVVLIALAWVMSALGVFIGSVMNSHDRVIGLCVLSSLLMAAIGGCWWPLELAGTWAQRLALFTPSGWALSALHKLISFGAGFEAVTIPFLVLAGFGVVATAAAAKFFRV